MPAFDYQPRRAGAFYDPGPSGGQVSNLALYGSPERTGDPAATVGPATRVRAGVYRFDVPGTLPDGRYWATVTYTPAEGAAAVTDKRVRLDMPIGTGAVVSPEDVAGVLGVPLPLTAQQREDFADAVDEATAAVTGYVLQELTPHLVELTEVTPWSGLALEDPDAWPGAEPYLADGPVAVDSYAQQASGAYNVVLRVGLDGAAEDPIRRYVTAHAAELLRARLPKGQGGGRRVTSVSAEGQSVSYAEDPAGQEAGAPPTLDSLDGYLNPGYRTLSVPAAAPWPYAGGRSRPRWW